MPIVKLFMREPTEERWLTWNNNFSNWWKLAIYSPSSPWPHETFINTRVDFFGFCCHHQLQIFLSLFHSAKFCWPKLINWPLNVLWQKVSKMLSLVARQNQLGTNWLMYIFTTSALNLKCTATVLPRSKKKRKKEKWVKNAKWDQFSSICWLIWAHLWCWLR